MTLYSSFLCLCTMWHSYFISNSTQTIVSIGNQVNLQYTDKEELIIAATGLHPVVCSSSVPTLVMLPVTLGYNASANYYTIYMKLNNTVVCKTTGLGWKTLVKIVASRPITFRRSTVKCFDNILSQPQPWYLPW